MLALVLGTANFGGMSASEARRLVECALANGITAFDTANSYGPAEDYLGRALVGRRHQVLLGTKVGNPYPRGSVGLSGAVIRRELAQSLKRLQTDYLDLYSAHNPDPCTSADTFTHTMERLIKRGEIRAYGACNMNTSQLREIVFEAPQGFTTLQIPYNILERDSESDLLSFAQRYRVKVDAYSPLAGGVLSGKYQYGVPAGSRAEEFLGVTEPKQAGYVPKRSHRNLATVRALLPVAALMGVTLSTLCLRWMASKPSVSRVIIGARDVVQLEENIQALTQGLPLEIEHLIDRMSA